jgi:hypothetical protein
MKLREKNIKKWKKKLLQLVLCDMMYGKITISFDFFLFNLNFN